jgi:hypothetical protein
MQPHTFRHIMVLILLVYGPFERVIDNVAVSGSKCLPTPIICEHLMNEFSFSHNFEKKKSVFNSYKEIHAQNPQPAPFRNLFLFSAL